MAVDSAAKRRSLSGVPFLPLVPGVTPDAAQPVAWRQQAGWGYSGISAAAATPYDPNRYAITRSRELHRSRNQFRDVPPS